MSIIQPVCVCSNDGRSGLVKYEVICRGVSRMEFKNEKLINRIKFDRIIRMKLISFQESFKQFLVYPHEKRLILILVSPVIKGKKLCNNCPPLTTHIDNNFLLSLISMMNYMNICNWLSPHSDRLFNHHCHEHAVFRVFFFVVVVFCSIFHWTLFAITIIITIIL